MKPPRKPEAALCFLRPYFRLFEDLLPRREADVIEERKW